MTQTLAQILIADQYAKRNYLVEVEPYTTSSLETFYYSDSGFTTEPTDDVPNCTYEARIMNALQFSRSMYAPERIGGASVPGFGVIELNNEDGELDEFKNYSWRGRKVRVYIGGDGFTRDDYLKIFDGVCEDVEVDDAKVSIHVRDLQNLLTVPVGLYKFNGTGAYDGNVDMKDQIIPLCYGECENIEPVNLGVISGMWTYKFHHRSTKAYDSTFHKLKDGANLLTYSSSMPPAAGCWTLDHANGQIVYRGNPLSVITADVLGEDYGTGSGTYPCTVHDIVRRIATTFADRVIVPCSSTVVLGTGSKTFDLPVGSPIKDGTNFFAYGSDESLWMKGTIASWNSGTGVLTGAVSSYSGVGTLDSWTFVKHGLKDPDDIDVASFTSFASAAMGAAGTMASMTVGTYIRDDVPISEVLDELINSAGAFYGFNRQAMFDIGLMSAPSGTPVLSLSDVEILELIRVPTRHPSWRQQIGYRKNFRVQTGGDISAALGNNLVSDGEFTTGSGWTLGSGWTIGSGLAGHSGGGAGDLSRAISLISGFGYYASLDVTRSAGTLQLKADSTDLGSAINVSGKYTIEFTAGAQTSLTLTADAAFVGTVDNVAVIAQAFTFVTREYRYEREPDPSVIAKFPLATEDVTNTVIRSQSYANAYAKRQQGIYGVLRDYFTVVCKTQPFSVDLGDVIEITYPRWGMSGGKLFTVVSMEEDSRDNIITMGVFG